MYFFLILFLNVVTIAAWISTRARSMRRETRFPDCRETFPRTRQFAARGRKIKASLARAAAAAACTRARLHA